MSILGERQRPVEMRPDRMRQRAEQVEEARLTVYRHFPDLAPLFAACSQRWIELHPPPDPAA